MNIGELIGKKLNSVRYSRIEKDTNENNWITTFSKCSNKYAVDTAEIVMELENEKLILISSHCLEDENGSDYFKLKMTHLNELLTSLKFWTKLENSEIISVQLYNQTVKSNFHFEKLDYDEGEFLSDAILIELSNEEKLVILGHTSIEEHEPRLDIGLLNKSEYNLYKSRYIEHWKTKKNYL